MYATMKETSSVAAARAFAENGTRDSGAGSSDPRESGTPRLPVLEAQICAEAGIWAPEIAARAASQAGGDIPRAVALLKVWAAALPHVESVPVQPNDVRIVRRLSSAFADIPGGQWLGAAPELASRLLDFDKPAPRRPAADGEFAGAEAASTTAGRSGTESDAPTRAQTSRVRALLTDVPIVPVPEDREGQDPAASASALTHDRASRLGVMARGDTASLVAFAGLVLSRRREAVLAELTTTEVAVRTPHPRSGMPCTVTDVPVVEAEAVLDADVDGRSGFAVGWGASLGTIERRAISLALLDGAMQADGELDEALTLDEPTLLHATDGSSSNGFVEHLRLPHHASFGSYLAQARDGEAQSGSVETSANENTEDHTEEDR